MLSPHLSYPFSGFTAALLLGLSLAPSKMAAAGKIAISQEIDAKWGYVGGSTLHGDGARFGSIDEQNSSLRYVLSPQVTRRGLLHFGAEWQRFSFGLPDAAPVPNTLQRINALFGIDWQFSDEWLFRAEIHPGVYSDFHDVSWKDVDVPILLSAAYLANADLQWVFGLRIDPRSSYPIIPAVGARWKFADEWTLRATLPEPRLEYEVSERFSAYFGAGFDAGAFRVSDTFGDGQGRSDLHAAVLDYFEVRIGPGFYWRIRPDITIGADAGCMVYRRFEYSEPDRVYSTHPAPYIQIACDFRF